MTTKSPIKQPALNVPILVPGLEEINPAYGSTLTADLKVVVFVGVGDTI